MKTTENLWQNGTQVGIFLAILFVICFFWTSLRVAGTASAQLHNDLLTLTFFGYSGLSAASFILGLIQSFIWGYIAVGLWYLAGAWKK